MHADVLQKKKLKRNVQAIELYTSVSSKIKKKQRDKQLKRNCAKRILTERCSPTDTSHSRRLEASTSGQFPESVKYFQLQVVEFV